MEDILHRKRKTKTLSLSKIPKLEPGSGKNSNINIMEPFAGRGGIKNRRKIGRKSPSKSSSLGETKIDKNTREDSEDELIRLDPNPGIYELNLEDIFPPPIKKTVRKLKIKNDNN